MLGRNQRFQILYSDARKWTFGHFKNIFMIPIGFKEGGWLFSPFPLLIMWVFLFHPIKVLKLLFPLQDIYFQSFKLGKFISKTNFLIVIFFIWLVWRQSIIISIRSINHSKALMLYFDVSKILFSNFEKFTGKQTN